MSPGGRDCFSFSALSESFTVNVYRYCDVMGWSAGEDEVSAVLSNP